MSAFDDRWAELVECIPLAEITGTEKRLRVVPGTRKRKPRRDSAIVRQIVDAKTASQRHGQVARSAVQRLARAMRSSANTRT